VKSKQVNEPFKSKVLLVLLKLCTSLLECMLLLENDFKGPRFEKVQSAWRDFMADYTNLLKVKEKEKSPDSPGAGEALNLDSGDSHG
jgi:hypothetical protein